MNDTLEVTPAYGEDYTSQAQVKAAWAAGKDFQIQTYGPDMGRYMNKADAKGLRTVLIRYAKLQKVMAIYL
jgi:hypothetical protein